MHIVEITDPSFSALLRKGHRVLTSLEGENPGGSIKDHMVKAEVREWLDSGRIDRTQVVSEISAGSTAFSLAHYCQQWRQPCRLFLPDSTPMKAVEKLRAMGAEVELVSVVDGYDVYQQAIVQDHLIPFEQMFDDKKRRHYERFGEQMMQSLPGLNMIIGAVGTGHSLLGVAQALPAQVSVISAEPEENWKVSGCRNIEWERYGERDSCRPELFDRRIVVAEDDLFPVSKILTDSGWVEVSDSFRLVMSALPRLLGKVNGPRTVFALGAANRRIQEESYLKGV